MNDRIFSLSQSARRALLAAFVAGGLGCVSDPIDIDPDWPMCVATCAKLSRIGPTTSREVGKCAEIEWPDD